MGWRQFTQNFLLSRITRSALTGRLPLAPRTQRNRTRTGRIGNSPCRPGGRTGSVRIRRRTGSGSSVGPPHSEVLNAPGRVQDHARAVVHAGAQMMSGAEDGAELSVETDTASTLGWDAVVAAN